MRNLVTLNRIINVLIIYFVGFSSFGSVFGQEKAKEESKSNFIAFPVLGSSPETGFMYGGAGSFIFRDKSSVDVRPSTIGVIGIATKKKQYTIGVGYEAWKQNDKYHLNVGIGIGKFPNNFYGIGNDALDTDEESYTPISQEITMSFEKKFDSGLYSGLWYHFQKQNITETETGGLLDSGQILGIGKSMVSGFGFTIAHDTRDNLFAASKGIYRSLSVGNFNDIIGSDFKYSIFEFDFRHYLDLGSSNIFASQLFVSGINGNAPFYKLANFGGERMGRGYYSGKYRDKNMVYLQSEYRSPVWNRLSAVIFGGVGDVAHKFSDFNFNDLKSTIGTGLRFYLSPEEKISLRLDFGFGRDGSNMYITFMEAF